MLGYIKNNCHILLSQPISLRYLPLHSLGNILIVYRCCNSIELGNSKQDVSLCNYRSQGMMEEQTGAEVTRNSHFCFSQGGGSPLFRLSSYSLFSMLPVPSLVSPRCQVMWLISLTPKSYTPTLWTSSSKSFFSLDSTSISHSNIKELKAQSDENRT